MHAAPQLRPGSAAAAAAAGEDVGQKTLPRSGCINSSLAETFPIFLIPVVSANINGLILQPGNEEKLTDRRNHAEVPLQWKTCRAPPPSADI